MNLERRIEHLEHSARAGRAFHVVHVPYVADPAGQKEAQRQALERNPAPRRTRLTVYLIDYSGAGTQQKL